MRKLDNLASTYSLLLAASVASNNIKDLRLYNDSLIAGSDVAFILVKNADDELL